MQFLLRDMPHLLQYSPPCSDRYGQLLPDGDHEPDLDAIAARYPLPRQRVLLVREARRRLHQQRGIYIHDHVYRLTVANVQTTRGFNFRPDRRNLARIVAGAHAHAGNAAEHGVGSMVHGNRRRSVSSSAVPTSTASNPRIPTNRRQMMVPAASFRTNKFQTKHVIPR
jgi:hypothetical protein